MKPAQAKALFTLLVLLCAGGAALAQQWSMIPDVWGYDPDLSMDPQGNVHVVWTRYTGSVEYIRYDAVSESWGSAVPIPYSSNLWEQYGRPKVDVGPDGKPHVVWGMSSLSYLMYARALTSNPQSAQDWEVSFIDVGWCAWPDVAADDQSNPHFAYQRIDNGWRVVYRDPWGNEMDVDYWPNEDHKPNQPAIKWAAGVVHYAWQKNDNDRGVVYYTSSNDWNNKELLSPNVPSLWSAAQPHVAVSPTTGKAGVVFFYDDWSLWGSTGLGFHRAISYSEPGGGPYMVELFTCDAQLAEEGNMWHNDWYPMIDYDSSGNRYVVWTLHDNWDPAPYYNKTYYRIDEQPVVELQNGGHIAIGAGANGGMMVRANPGGGNLYWCLFGGGPVYYPPTAVIDDISPNPAYQQQDVVSFCGSAWDNDENGQSITAYEWSSDKDGFLSNTEDFQRSADNLSVGQHVITFKVWDNENQTDQTTAPLTIAELYPPTARIDSIAPNPATQQIDIVHFEGSAWDNDEGGQSIVGYQWSSSLDGALAYSEDLDRPAADLTVGTHLITFEVLDDDNQTAQDTLTLIVVPPPLPPTAVIDSIVPNPAMQDVDTVAFHGSAWDNDENGESIVSYRWTSGLSGILSNQEDFSLPASSLPVGAHLITFKVWDDESQTAQDTMSIVIDPSPFVPPTAVIDSIVPQIACQEVDTVLFYGSAWDNDENGQAIEAYEWSSDLDGIIGGLEDVWLPADSLSIGEHLIMLQVWDDEDQTAQDTMTLVIEPSPYQPPTAVIDSIVPDTSYYGVDTVYFYGSAWDNDENGQSIEAYQWSSSLGGDVAAVADFFLPADSLSAGNHLITFRVWDDEQQTAQDTMTIVVLNPGSVPPSVVIDSIWPSPAMQQRDTLFFWGSAWDNDPTDVIESFQWWSSRLARVISYREDFCVPADSLPLGLNTVRFTAWDDEGDSAVAWGAVSIIGFTPIPPAPQQVTCDYEWVEDRVKLMWIGPLEATFNVYHDSLAYFVGADPAASHLTGPPWYHDNPDLTGPHFYYVTSENLGGESEPSERVGLVPYETGHSDRP